jgi:hypothetical protein
MIEQAGMQPGEHRFVGPGQVAPDRPVPGACVRCGQPEGEHPLDPRPLTCDAVELVYQERLLTAGRDRYDALAVRKLAADSVALLRERGEFDPAKPGHQALASRPPLTTDDYLEQMALGEALARYYRHPSMLDRAAKTGATWEQIGAARGTSVGQARLDYREWAVGQHDLHAHYGRWGLDDDEYAAAIARAGQDSARHTVTFDLMVGDNTDFVLTEALREFAARQRSEAADEDPGSAIARDRIRWAECAEAALDQIEAA